MRRITALIITILWIVIIPAAAFAEPDAQESTEAAASGEAAVPEETPTSVPTPEPTATPEATSEWKQGAPEIDMSLITADSAMLLDADTGEVLFSKNKDWTIFPASTTKLMTAILVAENCQPDEMITLTEDMKTEINKSAGSMMGLKNLPANTQISVKDLFYGLMLCSGNDAGIVFAMHISGSEQAFVEQMNKKTQELGMTGTHFLNPHGLYIHNEGYGHYSTAADMAKLAVAAQKYSMITEAAAAQKYTYESVSDFCQISGLLPNTVENSNYLLHTPVQKPELAQYYYENATGMKTGTLENILPPGATEYIRSYGCLVASAKSGNLNLIALIFGDRSTGNKGAGIPNSYARWEIAKYLFDYGFANYARVDLGQYVAPFSVTETIEGTAENDPQDGQLEVTADLSGEKTDVRLVDAATAQGLADGTMQLEQKTNIEAPLKAPINAGDRVGTVSYLLNGEEIYNAPLLASRKVYPAGDEIETSKEYGVPAISFEIWYLWIIIPAALALTLLIIRAVNLSRRRKRYTGGRPADITPARSRQTSSGRRDVPTRTVKARRQSPGGRGHRM